MTNINDFQTKTELHTHLIGMLSAESFLGLFEEFKLPIYINDYGEIDTENGYPTQIKNLSNIDFLIEQLSIPRNNQVDYSSLETYYVKRSLCLKKMVVDIKKRVELTNLNILDKYIIRIVYGRYLEKSLKELECQGVEYVEISYSNLDTIKEMLKSIKGKTNIKCKFLLCTLRSKTFSEYKQTAKKKLTIGLNDKIVLGFDINGQETELREDEIKDEGQQSIKRKIKVLIESLCKNKNSTLRIHSGETPSSFNNTECILQKLEEIKNELIIETGKKETSILPPPNIRIGHGIYFNNTENYIRLLKKFKVFVEINASSNYALKNIRDFNEIPYEYYLDNGIPIVLSTDGHGLYNTNILIEDKIALLNLKEKYPEILKIEKDFLGGKIR